ncbi:MAG TPA: 2-hydroxyacid dehydrogenase [Actinomycetes bacterium]|nr:2-hydroxyacid dehydrogenase [Actinomycetes bacterium]
MKVLVPQPEFAAALADLTAAADPGAAPADPAAETGRPADRDRAADQGPPGRALEVLVWSGAGSPPEDLTGIELHVPAYTFDPGTLEIMVDMPDLRVVQLLTAGVEHVLPYLPAGVTLCNARGVHDASAAELAVALMLASLRGLDDFARAQPAGKWLHERRDALADKAVLIVGYGAIGAAVDRRLAGFEVQVLRASRTPRPGVAPMSEVSELLGRADVVVLTVPATSDTRGLVDTGFLAAMRDGALLVNISRGTVVDTTALLAELSSGRLRAALDVTDPEPPPPGHPLWRAPGLLISPHVGGDTTAFLPRAVRLVRDQVGAYLAGNPLRNVVGRT